jgi:hypothetical protein
MIKTETLTILKTVVAVMAIPGQTCLSSQGVLTTDSCVISSSICMTILKSVVPVMAIS